jgi:hypothetical protein
VIDVRTPTRDPAVVQHRDAIAAAPRQRLADRRLAASARLPVALMLWCPLQREHEPAKPGVPLAHPPLALSPTALMLAPRARPSVHRSIVASVISSGHRIGIRHTRRSTQLEPTTIESLSTRAAGAAPALTMSSHGPALLR